jgi:hypothetical protein
MDVSFDLAWMMGGSWDTAGPSAWCDRFRICAPSGDGCPYLQNWWIEVSVAMYVFWRDAGRHHILLGIPWSIPFIRLACMSQVTNLNSCCVACVLLPLLSVPLIVFSVGEQIAFILIISTGPALLTSRPYATCPGRLTP